MGMPMTIQHKILSDGGWADMRFCEQMANIGSEISRSLNWRNKGKADLSQRAFYRALELMDLTIRSVKKKSYLRELCRTREALVDFFCGSNSFLSSEKLWRRYFDAFVYPARK